MVITGEFRADLCYRLNGYTINLPPLRDRGEDVPLLAAYYLRRFNTELGKLVTGVAPETMDRLRRYPWPGNIRELQTVLKHAMLEAVGPMLLPEFLPQELRDDVRTFSTSSIAAERHRHPLDEFIENQIRRGTRSLYADAVEYMDKILLTHVLRHTRGNQSQAAAILGITRGCLRSKIRLHGITINPLIAINDPGEDVVGEPIYPRASNKVPRTADSGNPMPSHLVNS
jgi:two-component system nitrogen regulation response regulator GlnG